ncbi:hypothetical protein VB779_08810 [Haloarculaceae archaeon H-GB11]|nr:hypothetical protein [Haloarculaceae archaeon H-GB11]
MPVIAPYRVYCDECDIQRPIASRILAEEMVQEHAKREGCGAADWEEVADE